MQKDRLPFPRRAGMVSDLLLLLGLWRVGRTPASPLDGNGGVGRYVTLGIGCAQAVGKSVDEGAHALFECLPVRPKGLERRAINIEGVFEATFVKVPAFRGWFELVGGSSVRSGS